MKKERFHKPGGKWLRYIIFGADDGLVSNLALVASLSGALLQNNIIIIAGLVEMLAGAISMSLGTYISTKSQIEFYKQEMMQERKNIKLRPEHEIQEIKELYRRKGFRGKELDMVVRRITSDKRRWFRVLIEEYLGLKGIALENPVYAAVFMFIAFIIGGFIPMITFIFFKTELLKYSIILSVFALFIVGAARTYYTERDPIKGGLEMVLIGSIAALTGYYFGEFVNSLF